MKYRQLPPKPEPELYVFRDPDTDSECRYLRELVPTHDHVDGDALVPVYDTVDWAFRYNDITMLSVLQLLRKWHIPFEIVQL